MNCLSNDFVKEQLRENNISMGHARAVLTLSNDEQSKIIREAIHKKLSVRAVENLAKSNQKNKIIEQKDQDTIIDQSNGFHDLLTFTKVLSDRGYSVNQFS